MKPSLIDLRPVFAEAYEPFIRGDKVNLGCAGNHLRGWTNVDFNPGCQPDVVADIRSLPFADCSFDTALATHVLEHLPKQETFAAVAEVYRILRPEGHFIIVTPHLNHDIAFNDPHHHTYFDESTFLYYLTVLYQTEGNAGYMADQGVPLANWELARITLVPSREYAHLSQEQAEGLSKIRRNVLEEIHAVFRKPVAS